MQVILAHQPRQHSQEQDSNDANLVCNPLTTCYGFITTLKLFLMSPFR